MPCRFQLEISYELWMQIARGSSPPVSKPYILVRLELAMALGWSSGYNFTREHFTAMCLRLLFPLGNEKAEQAMALREASWRKWVCIISPPQTPRCCMLTCSGQPLTTREGKRAMANMINSIPSMKINCLVMEDLIFTEHWLCKRIGTCLTNSVAKPQESCRIHTLSRHTHFKDKETKAHRN